MTFPKALSLAALLLACNAMAGLYASAAIVAALAALPSSESDATASEQDRAQVSAAPVKADCIKAPDAPHGPADKGRLPGQAFPSEALDEEEIGEALGPVAAGAAGIILLGGMLYLVLGGHSNLGYGDGPDTTNGLQPWR